MLRSHDYKQAQQCHVMNGKYILQRSVREAFKKKNSKKVGRRRPKTKFYLRKKIVTWRVGTKINFCYEIYGR